MKIPSQRRGARENDAIRNGELRKRKWLVRTVDVHVRYEIGTVEEEDD